MLALTQLVVVVDATIVTIALPQAQEELGLSDQDRQWVVTAYVLAFGALLLVGGRVADYWGRKRSFLVGMLGFGAASAWGGLAQSGTELIIARGAQGAFAALLAPAALALLTVTFPSGRQRITAFAVFGAVGACGSAVGLILGGVLTDFTSWRWCLLVNVIFVIVGIVGGLLFLRESKAAGENRYDVWGAVTVTLGLGALVYGLSRAEGGWGAPDTVGFIAAGLVLLALFVWIESRVAQPLLPLRVVLHPVRGGALLVQLLIGVVLIGATLYLTFYLQIGLGLRPLLAGLANVAMTVAILVATPVLTRILPRVGARVFMVTGPLVSAGGLLALTGITAGGNYFTQVLPGLVLLGIGLSMLFVPLQNLALTGVAPRDAGAASATVNAALQIGGSIGIPIFTAIYVRAVAEAANAGQAERDAVTSGYVAVFVAGAVAMVLASVIAFFMIRGSKSELLPDQLASR
ncbi:MFS transporter [uncultured Microbacterium sp.]|uniref:MFS transporter n=1 Tax=uncultured Microbacterium sp. TaxID=191216 RepID=UPI0035CC1903